MGVLNKKETKPLETIKKVVLEKETSELLIKISKFYQYDIENDKDDLNDVFESLLTVAMNRPPSFKKVVKEYIQIGSVSIDEAVANKLYEVAEENDYSTNTNDLNIVLNNLLQIAINKDKDFVKSLKTSDNN